jgi:hypothetical protein
MEARWFVRCKTCKARLSDQDSSFAYDPAHPQWKNPQWKSVISCPECQRAHEYTSIDLKIEEVLLEPVNSSSPSIRVWAERLLAVEAANPSGPVAGPEVVRVCERLRVSLAQFVGADGFTALLRRALALARVEVPSLQTARVTSDGRLEGIEEAGGEAGSDAEAAITITAHFLGLLVTFVGQSLARRLMRKAFPDTSEMTKSEDL